MTKKIPVPKAIRLPRRMPNDFILSKIAFPPSDSLTKPLDGKNPKLCFGTQWRIKNCADFIKMPSIDLPTPELFYKLPKGHNVKLKSKKEAKIAENMLQMDKRIQEYKNKRKEKKAPEMPF